MKLLIGAASALLLQAGAASAATVDFDFAGALDDEMVSVFQQDGLALTVSATTVGDDGAIKMGDDSAVTRNAGGLGVRNNVTGKNPEKNSFLDGASKVGNNDILLFDFGQPVTSVVLSFLERDGFDGSMFALYAPAGDSFAQAGTFDLDEGGSLALGGSSFGIAALGDADQFLVSGLTVETAEIAPVPLPAAGALMLAGLGGLFVARRRR